MTTAAQAHAMMRALPIADVGSILGHKPALILAPHPDDEILGCGGLMMQSLAAGLNSYVMIVTDGSASHPNSRKFPPSVMSELRAAEACEAAARIGLPPGHLHFLTCRDTAAPHDGPEFDLSVTKIAEVAVASGCGVICAPWRFDPHCDHLAVHKMAAETARCTGLRHLSYPVWGWTLPGDQDLGPLNISGSRLRIDHLLGQKRHALQAHATQLAGIVDDDPTGFQLTPPMLDQILLPFEVFLDNP